MAPLLAFPTKGLDYLCMGHRPSLTPLSIHVP
jgi:hypothetical protein